MRRLFISLAAFVALGPGVWAQTVKISALPAASSVADADVAPIVQGGVTKKAAISLFRAITASQISDSTGVGRALLTVTNPSAIRFIKINADNTVTLRTAAEMLSDIGAQASGSYGDFSSNTSTSVDSEIVLFSGTGGKTGKRATATGILKGASGVLSAATAGTDYTSPTSTETMTNKTLTAPKFADLGFIADANGNELIILDTVTSAVNEWTLANAATGANPVLTASGGDSNVGLDFKPKGTGVFNFLATTSGPAELRWFEDSDNGTNYAGVIAPASIASNYAVTLPNAASTLPIFGQQITFSGPTAARTVTFPDASFTAARTDAAQTFTGVQSMTSPDVTTSITTPSTTFSLANATATTVNAFGAATTLNIGASAATVLNFGGSTTAAELRFLEPSGSGTNYTAIKAKAQAANITYTLPDTVASPGQFLKDAAGDGVLSWATPSGSGTVTATGGSLTANSVVLGAGGVDTKVVSGIITDGTSKVTLGVAGTSVGSVDFKNATSGTITLSPVTGALGTVTLSLPAATGTITSSADKLSVFSATTSSELRGVLSDESGTGAAVFAGGDIGAATATTPAADDNDTSVATTAYVQGELALPRSYLSGLGMANNATDAVNDIDIAVGECRDSTNAKDLRLASAITKRLDAAWTVGTNQGGLDTGSIANTTYHIWLIMRSDTGVVDALFSTSATAPTMPTNYNYKRRIGSIIRVSAAIKAFIQDGDDFIWDVPVKDISGGTIGTTATLITLTVPAGIKVFANTVADIFKSAAAPILLVTSPDQTDTDPVNAFTIFGNAASTYGQALISTRTNTSNQIRVRASAASSTYDVETVGWKDKRGRDD